MLVEDDTGKKANLFASLGPEWVVEVDAIAAIPDA